MEDMIITAFGQETAFLNRAAALGYSSLTLLYSITDMKKVVSSHQEKLRKSTTLTLKFGLVVKTDKINPLQNDFSISVALGTRILGLSKTYTHVYDNEIEEEKDFIHQRRSGLNHVLLRQFKEKNVSVLFSYVALQKASMARKAVLMGRVAQNIALCKKDKVDYMFVSLAEKPEQLRSKTDVGALQRVISSL